MEKTGKFKGLRAYDAYTNMPMEKYNSYANAARFHNCDTKDVVQSTRDHSHTINGVYFKKVFDQPKKESL